MSTPSTESGGTQTGARAWVDLALKASVLGVSRLDEMRRNLSVVLARDMQAIRERDPAARSDLEILTCYPSLHAVWMHRMARYLWQRQVPVIPRLMSQMGRFLTGIEIHPGATLGEGFFVDHGSGVVIGETAEVGENVTMYQGVTLGGTGKETGKRHPTVGDNVVIGAGCLLLGSIRVGDNVKVGSGSVVIHDVPADSTVVGNPGRVVINQGAKVGIPDIDYTHLPDPVAEAMKCLVRRVVQLEKEVEELRASGAEPVGIDASGPATADRPSGPSPAAEIACDPERLDGTPDV